MSRSIFVFGSNLAGRHGKGAALTARQKHGAVYGNGVGRQNNSYAIPTKNADLRPLPLDVVAYYVDEFIQYAKVHPELDFRITNIGCGLAGNRPHEIAVMFNDAPANCMFEPQWLEWLNCLE